MGLVFKPKHIRLDITRITLEAILVCLLRESLRKNEFGRDNGLRFHLWTKKIQLRVSFLIFRIKTTRYIENLNIHKRRNVTRKEKFFGEMRLLVYRSFFSSVTFRFLSREKEGKKPWLRVGA